MSKMPIRKRILSIILFLSVSALLVTSCVKAVNGIKSLIEKSTAETTASTTAVSTTAADASTTRITTTTTATTTTTTTTSTTSKATSSAYVPEQTEPGTTKKPATTAKKVTTTTQKITTGFLLDAQREAYLNEIKGKKKLIAFTFDDGPAKNQTNKLLDSLNKYNARVTFFVTGDRVQTYASTLRRAYEMGNQIGSHTYSHKNLAKLKEDELRQQIDKTNKEIHKVLGFHPGLLRPPYGSYNDKVKKASGVPVILWNIDTLDWKNRNAQKICDNIVNNAHDGAIVLMHDLYETTVDGALMAMDKLQEKGYAFVTVGELAYLKDKTLENGKVYSSIK